MAMKTSIKNEFAFFKTSLYRVYFIASLNLSNEGVFPLVLPNSLRQHPHFKRRRKFLISFSGFFFQVRALYKSSHKNVSHRRRAIYVKKCVTETKLLFFAQKTNRFWRSRFLCRSGLTFHSWWDWGQVYSKNNNNKTFTKGAILQCEHSFLDSGEYSKNVT